jgi:rubrerythrin
MKNVKCMICGMIINERNYFLNSSGIMNENSGGKIASCPFCGVDSQYLNEYGIVWWDKVGSMDSLSGKIIDHAMKLEVFNGDFYKRASEMAREERLKKMFLELSNIEFMHARIHQKLGGFQSLPVLKELDYSRLSTDSLLLEEARKREGHAVAYYSKYGGKVTDEALQEVFKALSKVEEEHISLTMV